MGIARLLSVTSLALSERLPAQPTCHVLLLLVGQRWPPPCFAVKSGEERSVGGIKLRNRGSNGRAEFHERHLPSRKSLLKNRSGSRAVVCLQRNTQGGTYSGE